MKRLVVKCTDGEGVNIEADRLTQIIDDVNYIVAMNGKEIVGVFDIGSISFLYLSEMNTKN